MPPEGSVGLPAPRFAALLLLPWICRPSCLSACASSALPSVTCRNASCADQAPAARRSIKRRPRSCCAIARPGLRSGASRSAPRRRIVRPRGRSSAVGWRNAGDWRRPRFGPIASLRGARPGRRAGPRRRERWPTNGTTPAARPRADSVRMSERPLTSRFG